MSEKRTRKKSRRLSEAQLAEKEGEEPPKKKRRQLKPETPPQRPKKLVVSLSNSLLSTRVVEKLQNGSPGARNGREGGGKDRASGAMDSTNLSPQNGMRMKFKNPHFSFSYLASNKKKRWRNRKQLVMVERALTWKPDDPTYSSIDVPPPLKPPKKYADISGVRSKYTDPLTGLYFSSSEEFELIRTLPSDILQGYLALRGKVPVT